MSIFRTYKTIEDLLPGFMLEKEVSTQRKTTQSYRGNIMVFLDWLDSKGRRNEVIKKITDDDIREFFYYLGVEKGLDKPTCQRYFMHLRSLFMYADTKGEIDIVPFNSVVFPRKKKDQGAEVIHHNDLKPLLLEIKKVDPQLYLGCLIQYYCFIRPGREMRLLKIGDIDCETGLITVRQENAKNKLKQIVTMPQHLIDVCREYSIDTENKDLFVFGKKGMFGTKPISVNMLRWRFNAIRDSLNMSRGYKFYSFKHTGASMLHKSGISMRELMEQLRHTKLEATQHYLKQHCGIVNDRIRDNFPNPLE